MFVITNRIGPRGTAICVYRADDTGGLNRGIFEVFREDLVTIRSDGTTDETENNYVRVCWFCFCIFLSSYGFLCYTMQCSSSGRPLSASNDVLSVQEVIQIGEDPILVLDGVM